MDKPRIVFLINSLEGGGAERVMARLLSRSKERLATVDFCLVLLDDVADAYQPPDWLTVYRLGAGGRLLPSLRKLARLFQTLKPQLVVSFLPRANIANLMTALLDGHKTVISERSNASGHYESGHGGKLSAWLVRRLYPRARKVIAVSQGIATDLVDNFGVAADRAVVISNPVDAERVRASAAQGEGKSPRRPYILGMGRFVEGKNFRLLIEAFAAAPLQEFDLELLGQGPLDAELRALVSSLGISDRVRFQGFLSNPFPHVAKAAAYVLPSNGEGFPNGLVEAMALGVPVISTDCRSGPGEILDDLPDGTVTGVHRGRYGILVPPNDKNAMVGALTLIKDAAFRADYSQRALDGAGRYGLDSAVQHYWDAFSAALKSPGK